MKKIIIIAMLFNLNLFADEAFEKIVKCENAPRDANPQICIDAANLYKKKKNLTTREKKLYAEAYFNAGVRYNRRGKFNNYKKAYEAFKKSENLNYNNSDLFNYLGVCYNEGHGTTVNKFKAYKMYVKATKMGNEYSQGNLDSMCEHSP